MMAIYRQCNCNRLREENRRLREVLEWFMEMSGLDDGPGGLVINEAEGRQIYENFTEVLFKTKKGGRSGDL